MDKTILNNITRNKQSLLIICISVIVFFAFSIKESGSPNNIKTSHTLKLGLYIDDGNKKSKEYYSHLIKTLQSTNIENSLGQLEIKHYKNIDAVCSAFKNGEIEIAGELSPIEYVFKSSECGFRPFLGLEYNNKTYYRSIFFSADGVNRFEEIFKNEAGYDNLKKIQDLLDEDKSRVGREAALALHKSFSTSGYYYPRSYLIDKNINPDRRHEISSHEDIYRNVLEKTENNQFLGGFLADFRYDKYKKKYKDDAAYSTPFIIDKSDPIPNGVFVISKKLMANKNVDLVKIKRIWKTMRDIDLVDGPKITGWRDGVKRDLALVEKHKNKVDYYFLYKKNHQIYTAIFIAIIVVALCCFTGLYLKVFSENHG